MLRCIHFDRMCLPESVIYTTEECDTSALWHIVTLQPEAYAENSSTKAVPIAMSCREVDQVDFRPEPQNVPDPNTAIAIFLRDEIHG